MREEYSKPETRTAETGVGSRRQEQATGGQRSNWRQEEARGGNWRQQRTAGFDLYGSKLS